MPDLATAQENTHQTALDAVLAKTGAKDRTHIQRHLTAADAEPDPAHASLWRKLAELLASLAPLPVQAVGHTAVMFFVPDGKYRMQAFALEDQSDGRIALYLPDILAESVRKKILKKADEPLEYAIVGSQRSTLHVEALDAQNTPEPATHVKNMLGWNRKSLRITLPIIGTDRARLQAVDALVNLAAKQWANRLTPPPAAASAPAPAATPPRTSKSVSSKKRTA
jgi:hypothetical protein